MIPDLNNPNAFLQAMKEKKGNGFNIPDLSDQFPGIDSFGDVNVGGEGSDRKLVGNPVTGDKSGKLTPLNVNKLERLALQADQLGYNLSDEDFARRFPELVAARNYNIESSRANLAGERDPFIYNALKDSGLGDIDFGTGEHNIERNMGIKIGSKEQRDRTYFQRLLQDNPQRAFGLNSKDVARIALANTNGINMAALGLAQGNVEQALANTQSDAASQAALIGAIGSLGAAGAKAFTSRNSFSSPTLTPNYYAPPAAPSGYYSGSNFGYGDPYSGNFYDASGNYVGNTITGEGW